MEDGRHASGHGSGQGHECRELLERVPWQNNSDDFVFDNQMLAQIVWQGFVIAEISCPTKYFPEASSINFRRSVRYGFGCLATASAFRLARLGLRRSRLFQSPCLPPPGDESKVANSARSESRAPQITSSAAP